MVSGRVLSFVTGETLFTELGTRPRGFESGSPLRPVSCLKVSKGVSLIVINLFLYLFKYGFTREFWFPLKQQFVTSPPTREVLSLPDLIFEQLNDPSWSLTVSKGMTGNSCLEFLTRVFDRDFSLL